MTQSLVNDFNAGLTLGRGQLLFAKLNSADKLAKNAPFEFIGNCPEFNLTVETEDLEHFKSTRGIGEKDASITLQVNRTATVSCDDIKDENLSRYLFGAIETISVAASTVTADLIEDVRLGEYYQLGIDDNNPTGVKAIDIDSVVVQSTDATPITYVIDEDYVVDAQRGMIRFLEDGDIAEGDDVTITYDIEEHTIRRVKSGNEPVRVAVKFIAENPKGPQREVFMPLVNVRPEGDLGFISGDDWATIGLNLEVLTDTKGTAVYIDGVPTIV